VIWYADRFVQKEIASAHKHATLDYPASQVSEPDINCKDTETGDTKNTLDNAGVVQTSVSPENVELGVKDAEDPNESITTPPTIKKVPSGDCQSPTGSNSPTEQLFVGFVLIIASFMSLAHGANDVANSVGPFGGVLAAYNGPLTKKSEIPLWVFLVAGFMIAVGLGTYGANVMNTIGKSITPVTPSKAFCAQFAATIVILVATRAGIPISTTHASVGAVVGVGLADGVRNVDWKQMAKIACSWVVTLPIVGITAAGIFGFLLPCAVKVPFA
jgi:phosphate/sulfate permease